MGRNFARSKSLNLSQRRLSRRRRAKLQWDSRRAALRLKAIADIHIKTEAQFTEDPLANCDSQAQQNYQANSYIKSELDLGSSLNEDNDAFSWQSTEPNLHNETDSENSDEKSPEITRLQQAQNIVNNGVPTEGVQITDRHIVDISYLLEQIHEKFDNHNPELNCSFRNVIQKESCQYGLQTQIFFECRVCKFQESVWTDRNDEDSMTINQSIVAGTMDTGIGYLQLQKLLASVRVPCMSLAAYRRYNMELLAAFAEASQKVMLETGEVYQKRTMD